MRLAPLIASVSLVFLGLAGCKGDPQADGDRPIVTTPEPGKSPQGDAKSSGTTPAKGDRVLAEIDKVKVTESQVLPALYEAYGLDILLKVVQLDLARDATAQVGITVSPADVEAERALTLKLAFPDQKPEDYDQLLTQLLSQQHVSRAEFAIVMETNANLRALVKKPAEADITEDAIHQEFNAVYGERVRVRDIALNNLQEVAEALARLKTLPFEEVAKQMSANRVTAAQGGELPPFARTSGNWSDVFIQAAFALKPGEVSTDAIQEGKYYHLIKVLERLAPIAVKYEDVRDSVREELIHKRQNGMMTMRRGEMAQAAIKTLVINEPGMKKQFEARLAAANPTPADRAEVRKNLDEQRDRLNATTGPTTAPTTAPDPTTAP